MSFVPWTMDTYSGPPYTLVLLPYAIHHLQDSKTMPGQRSQRSQRSGQGHQRQRLEGFALTSVESEGFEVREGLRGMLCTSKVGTVVYGCLWHYIDFIEFHYTLRMQRIWVWMG